MLFCQLLAVVACFYHCWPDPSTLGENWLLLPKAYGQFVNLLASLNCSFCHYAFNSRDEYTILVTINRILNFLQHWRSLRTQHARRFSVFLWEQRTSILFELENFALHFSSFLTKTFLLMRVEDRVDILMITNNVCGYHMLLVFSLSTKTVQPLAYN